MANTGAMSKITELTKLKKKEYNKWQKSKNAMNCTVQYGK